MSLATNRYAGFPLGLEKLENLDKWEGIFQSGKKSRNFEETRKVRENHTKYGKSQGISEKFYLLFFSDIQMNCVLFAKMDK